MLIPSTNLVVSFFFFSSRRRHTRWPRDWSSDVCSSDLRTRCAPGSTCPAPRSCGYASTTRSAPCRHGARTASTSWYATRSEERRVGEEGRWDGRQQCEATENTDRHDGQDRQDKRMSTAT